MSAMGTLALLFVEAAVVISGAIGIGVLVRDSAKRRRAGNGEWERADAIERSTRKTLAAAQCLEVVARREQHGAV